MDFLVKNLQVFDRDSKIPRNTRQPLPPAVVQVIHKSVQRAATMSILLKVIKCSQMVRIERETE